MSATTSTSTTITLRLPVRTAKRLRERAARENTTVNAMMRRLVDQHLSQPVEGESAYEALKDYIGCCDSGGTADARNIKQEFGEYLERKHREGRL